MLLVWADGMGARGMEMGEESQIVVQGCRCRCRNGKRGRSGARPSIDWLVTTRENTT